MRGPTPALRDTVRAAFARWGRPQGVRVDNGAPGGSSDDLPPPLALWLIGCGVAVQWNRPRRPQDNGVVERSMGTAKRWGEPHPCGSAAELQTRLDDADWVQWEAYPAGPGASRAARWPGLSHSRRAYGAAWEARRWDRTAAREALAGYAVARRVDRNGKVSLYDRPYHLGRRRAAEDVGLEYDPEVDEWVASAAGGTQLRRWPAGVTYEAVAERRTL